MFRTLRDFDGKVCYRVCVISVDSVMSRTHMTLGYRELTLMQSGLLGEKDRRIRRHEFHYSHLENAEDLEYVGCITDAQWCDCGGDGIAVNNAVAFYTHLHFSSHFEVPVSLIQVGRKRHERGEYVH